MVNSNFYGIDAILVKPTSVQAARAANVVYGMLSYMREVEREEVSLCVLFLFIHENTNTVMK